MHFVPRVFALTVLFAASLSGRAAPPPLGTAAPLTPIAPFPAAAEYIASRKLPANIDWGQTGAAPQRGDNVLLLFTLEQGGKRRQWIARLEADDLRGDELKLPPVGDSVWNTSTGRRIAFRWTRTAIRVHVAGPFDERAPPARRISESTDRALVCPEALNAGLDRFCRHALKMNQRVRERKATDDFYIAGTHMDEKARARGRLVAEALGITEDDEREQLMPYHSLNSFFDAAMENDTFRGILKEVVEWPSLWSIARNMGVSVSLYYPWNKVPTENPIAYPASTAIYHMQVEASLNRQLALRATLAVAAPQPPLQVSAGIVGICAEHPKDKSRRLFIQLIGSERAAETARSSE